jgi:hypothetical protein
VRLKQPRGRSEKYLAALRSLPCVCCGATPSEAAHIRLKSQQWERITGIRTGAGGSEKPNDFWALPLCALHHRTGPTAEHRVGTVAFWRESGLDPHHIAHALNVAFPNHDAMVSVVAGVIHFNDFKTEKQP